MSLQVTDEADRREAGRREELKKVLRQHGRSEASRAQEIVARNLDKTMVKNPVIGKRYKWVNRTANDGERVQIHEGYGYETVPVDKDDKTAARPIVGIVKDDAWVQGSQVLMQCDEEIYEQRRAEVNARTDRAAEAHRQKVRSNINKDLRDTGFAPPHTDMTVDSSQEGPIQTAVIPKRKAP